MSVRRTAITLTGALLLAPLASPAEARVGPAVTIVDFAFQPASVSTALSTPVVWTNTGVFDHLVRSDDNGFFNTGVLATDETGAFGATIVGTFAYHCQIHPSMKGSLHLPVGLSSASTVVGTTVSVRVGAPSAAGRGFAFDVQRRRGMGRWVAIEKGLKRMRFRFTPKRAGLLQLRARTHNARDAVSSWSPAATLTVVAPQT